MWPPPFPWEKPQKLFWHAVGTSKRGPKQEDETQTDFRILRGGSAVGVGGRRAKGAESLVENRSDHAGSGRRTAARGLRPHACWPCWFVSLPCWREPRFGILDWSDLQAVVPPALTPYFIEHFLGQVLSQWRSCTTFGDCRMQMKIMQVRVRLLNRHINRRVVGKGPGPALNLRVS